MSAELPSKVEDFQVPEGCAGCPRVKGRIVRRILNQVSESVIQSDIDEFTSECPGRDPGQVMCAADLIEE
jgi:hypothetical protein